MSEGLLPKRDRLLEREYKKNTVHQSKNKHYESYAVTRRVSCSKISIFCERNKSFRNQVPTGGVLGRRLKKFLFIYDKLGNTQKQTHPIIKLISDPNIC